MNLKKYRQEYWNATMYLKYFEKYKLDEKMIILDSQRGRKLDGNIFYLIKELVNNEEYREYKLYVTVTKERRDVFESLLRRYGFKVELLIVDSIQYYKVLAKAKYIILDTSLPISFIKKEGQVILNVWHGTPLKALGKKDSSGYASLGNVQKSFFLADYLLYPNEFMMEHMLEDYMLHNIAEGKCVLSGYPRNEVFFQEPNLDIVDKLGLQDMELIAYMPTWRGAVGKADTKAQIIHITHYLLEIDKQLSDKQVMLVNLHPFVGNKLDYSLFKQIKPFPVEYEVYEVLNVCNQLVTDYSSVFFDYANTGRKITLFAYDEEEYIQDRGMYLQLNELPFPVVSSVEGLLKELNTEKLYDDAKFMKTYCGYENSNASASLLEHVLLGKDKVKEVEIQHNGKDNIIIYSGNLSKNGITTALMNLLREIDRTKHNYYLTFSTRAISPHKEILLNLPEGVGYIPSVGKMNATLKDKIAIYLFKKFEYGVNDTKLWDRLYGYEIRRTLGNIEFSNAVQYSGYEMKRQMMFGRFSCNKIIYVHSNMIQEVEVKGAQKASVLQYAYNNYDKVVLVTEDMRVPTKQYCKDESKMFVANNIVNYKMVIEKSKGIVEFDENTESTVDIETLLKVLDGDGKVFINIGRFSPEKGHRRLIDAFGLMCEKEKRQPYLIILGGYGVIYKEILEYAGNSEFSNRIIVIKSMSNPFPLLKRCDYFVLSSLYEGFGLVLVESDILGVPVMSTDILGPRLFMQEHGGLLVEESIEAIAEGMAKMLDGKAELLGVDYEIMNRQSVDKFELLLK